jgi:hypothetical protein
MKAIVMNYYRVMLALGRHKNKLSRAAMMIMAFIAGVIIIGGQKLRGGKG